MLQSATMVEVALNVVQRLRKTLAVEAADLRGQKLSGLTETNQSKGRCLLELSRIAPQLQLAHDSDELAGAVDALCKDLEESRRLLRLQLDAACEVTAAISRAIQDEISDGTYSATRRRD